MGADGRRRLPKAADRVGALVLFLDEALRETTVFRHEYPPPRGRRLSNTGTIFLEKPLEINENQSKIVGAPGSLWLLPSELVNAGDVSCASASGA